MKSEQSVFGPTIWHKQIDITPELVNSGDGLRAIKWSIHRGLAKAGVRSGDCLSVNIKLLPRKLDPLNEERWAELISDAGGIETLPGEFRIYSVAP